ncbi:hypothetical protein TNCT_243301 [Trichonephila clavata]|uniref:Uncharacterized protein n=1 Tax=Trichonephila clavata TaxID=2740835 RepID=A0A8X6GYW7_TRICU|nr:hypothetical protein TNCT_243301 [Trichonephila clavata]
MFRLYVTRLDVIKHHVTWLWSSSKLLLVMSFESSTCPDTFSILVCSGSFNEFQERQQHPVIAKTVSPQHVQPKSH